MIVIKKQGVEAPEGAKKLYRDALVEKGTLLNIDFSNSGSTDGFDINNSKKVYDLAREAETELGLVQNKGVFNWGKAAVLTAGKGLESFGNVAGSTRQGAFVDFNASQKLIDDQPNTIFIAWVRQHIDRPTTGQSNNIIASFDNPASMVENDIFRLRAPLVGQSWIMDIAGGSTSATALPTPKGTLVQLAVEFTGVGNPINMYYNGAPYVTPSTGSATGFADAELIVFGKFSTIADVGTQVGLYRVHIENLDESGRSALELVKKDYEYVYGIGQFAGTPKRPFVDTY